MLFTFLETEPGQFPVLDRIRDRINDRKDAAGVKARDDALDADADAVLNGDLFADNGSGADSEQTIGDLEIASVNGSFADVGETITLDSGALLTVYEDGTFDYDANGAFDDLTDGEFATETFTYQARSTSSPFAMDQATVTITVGGVNGAPVITSGGTASLAENETDTGYTATADDDPGSVISFSITGGADAALFSIDSDTGELTFNVAPDFENLGDDDGDNAYELVITATDDDALSGSQSVTVTVTNADETPVITSGGSASAAENQTDAGYTAAAQPDAGDDVVFSISGGVDAALFSIDADTGELTFNAAPDFENPGDDDGDNAYEVEITATDNGGLTDAQAVTINVTDQNEAPVLAAGAAEIIDVETLSPQQGFILRGDTAYDIFGISSSSAGDINGDGFDDMIVGAAYGYDGGIIAGEAYVVFGGDSGFGTADGSGRNVLDMTSLAPDEGFILQGANGYDITGASVSSAGDINGDGIDDMIVGAPYLNGFFGAGPGKAYVIFGSTEALGAVDGTGRAVIDLADLDAEDGFIIQGSADYNSTGFSSASAGDVNGDGLDDVIVGAFGANNSEGEAYVIFGSEDGFGAIGGSGADIVNAATLTADQGFVIKGDAADDSMGYSVSGAGDINGDGLADVIVGADYGGDGGAMAGEAYVIFGSDGGFGSPDGDGRQVIDLTNLAPEEGFIIQGDESLDGLGRSVSNAGDIDGDGFDDIIVGAPAGGDGGSYAGEAYVLFGGDQGFGTVNGTGRSVVDMTGLSPEAGFVIQGVANNYTGIAVSSAGDMNGDGFDDLIIGAALPFGGSIGKAYVLFGGDNGFGSVDGTGRQVVDLDNLTGDQGFVIDSDILGSSTGFAVSAAGDIDNDGFDDIIVPAPGEGDAYVIYGRANVAADAYVSVGEGQTDTGYSAAAADPDSTDTLTYSITGGADAAAFVIDAATGALSFASAPDFETPGDADGFNDYEVEISVTDSGGLTDSQLVAVTVTDVSEGAGAEAALAALARPDDPEDAGGGGFAGETTAAPLPDFADATLFHAPHADMDAWLF
ncbi:beta strand repeat-containing protein [Euryhalocaulis caribicus]|uniref:beta strand repeat-containing protein n=1 Tax=Euryhalocaulis caribicus TaxID=1161401 RepID=UPI0003A0C7E3|nr:cadherin domain-containing protein [Euryhalocaulis caribicus]